MQQKKCIHNGLRLGVSVSVALLYCSAASLAFAAPRYYAYPAPLQDEPARMTVSDNSGEGLLGDYQPLAPQPKHSVVAVPAFAKTQTQTQVGTFEAMRPPVANVAVNNPAATQAPQLLQDGSGKNLAVLAPAAGEVLTVPPLPPLPGQPSVQIISPPQSAPTSMGPDGASAIVPIQQAPQDKAQPGLQALQPKPQPLIELPVDLTHGLSDQSKNVLNKLPPEKISKTTKKLPVAVEHFRKTALETESEVKEHDGIGMSIRVKRPKADVSHVLETAYEALIAGNQENAVDLYKEVLAEYPTNKLALFGLATTYHRAGQIQLARPLYAKLLAIDPLNKEGLNNFLVLLADESPDEALSELKRLETTHPSFSPVPAQMAIIYEKMGHYAMAAEAMNHAIGLSPESLKYRYDMAIILDKQGAWADAANFYQQLITANERGERIPAKAEEIQERLTFIRSNKYKG